ncbi:hypothetical protein H5410_001102 [Solanum commersonii]|uniref:Uncharacterized protein n=1 Tax=Solanum commersonii TaxID=4109 RepID=A0A9J6AYB4_SOLCO|nr:hypothetical protein H5410_001102 [Solanum commersonii]
MDLISCHSKQWQNMQNLISLVDEEVQAFLFSLRESFTISSYFTLKLRLESVVDEGKRLEEVKFKPASPAHADEKTITGGACINPTNFFYKNNI